MSRAGNLALEGDHWKVISAAKEMRQRLIDLKIITDKNFQDGYFVNSDWKADLSLLYAQKKKLGK
jgi:hypothetical protein